MKINVVVLFFLFATNAFGHSATAGDAQAVAQRDRALNTLISHHDAVAARDFYDDQFVLTTSSGKMKNKDALLAEIMAAGLSFEANETSEVVVRVHGDTALLTAILHQKGVFNGKSFDSRLRVTDTWVREGNTWQLLGGHASAL